MSELNLTGGRARADQTRPGVSMVVAAALAAILAACGTAVVSPASAGGSATSPGPTTPAAGDPALAWTRAAVELPPAVAASPPGSTLPGASPGTLCSGCPAAPASLFSGIAAVAGGLLAVGVQEAPTPSRAIAFASTDGRTWLPVTGFAPAADTRALAVARIGSREVIVGGVGNRAAAWASVDGSTWSAAPAAQAFGAPAAGSAQISAVVAWHGRFVAAGHRDPDASHRAAAIWVSEDGLTWQLVAYGPGFGNAWAYGIASTDSTLVVVGASGDQATGAAVAWTSTDAEHWAPVSSPALAAGSMRAIAANPSGLVAVGAGIADDRAITWTSADGLTWDTSPATPDLLGASGPVRMLAVAPIGTGFLAAGWKADTGGGSGVVWRSDDGRTWSRVVDQASMSRANLSGVASLAGRPVIVGTSGYPDRDEATAWTEASGP